MQQNVGLYHSVPWFRSTLFFAMHCSSFGPSCSYVIVWRLWSFVELAVHVHLFAAFFVMYPPKSTHGTEPNPPPWRAGPTQEGLLGKGFATIDDTCKILPKQASSSTWVMELKPERTFGSECDTGFARTMSPLCPVVDVRRRGWICHFAKFHQMPHCR